MHEITHYRNTTIADIKRQILNEASSITEQIELLLPIQKALLKKVSKSVIEDKMNDYKYYLERYNKICELMLTLQTQRKVAMGDLKPVAELEKASFETPQIEPLVIDVRT